MKLNRTLAYGYFCLHYLAQMGEGRWVGVAEIARREGLPKPYLNKVLRALREARLVESHRGKGFRLAKPLARISAWEFLEAMTLNGAPKHARSGASFKLFEPLNRQLGRWLSGMTLGDAGGNS